MLCKEIFYGIKKMGIYKKDKMKMAIKIGLEFVTNSVYTGEEN